MKWLAILIVLFLILFGCNMQSNDNKEAEVENVVQSEFPDGYVDTNKIKVDLIADIQEENATIKVGLTNENELPVELFFSRGQVFEVEIKRGEEHVYREFIEDEDLLENDNVVTINTQERVEWTTSWNLRKDNVRVEGGIYDITIYFLPYSISEMEVNDTVLVSSTTIEIPSENSAFRNVVIDGVDGKYFVQGEASVYEAQFLYMVEDGHNVLIDETPVTVQAGGPSWSPFEIEISLEEENLPTNGSITLVLYERSVKDDSMTNELYITLEQFEE